jgi:hypothetical protein
MARCYHCGQVLDDEWMRKQGASLMGKKGGKNKTPDVKAKLVQARWGSKRKKNKVAPS